jgi:hypothetical protein
MVQQQRTSQGSEELTPAQKAIRIIRSVIRGLEDGNVSDARYDLRDVIKILEGSSGT